MSEPTLVSNGNTRVEKEHYSLKAGDIDPELNKKIYELVLNADEFVVYIAEDLTVQWRTTDQHQQPQHCGEVLGRAAVLEAQSQFILDRKILAPIRLQIAEAIARCFAGNSKADSMLLLQEVKKQLGARNKEVAWLWYFTAAYAITGICVVLLCIFWIYRQPLTVFWGTTAFEVILGSLCGPLGAILSATSRARHLVLDANAGRTILCLEGLSRIGAGIIGSAFIGLALKSGMIMGGVEFAGSKTALLLALCTAAGASERLIPSLISAFERTALDTEQHANNIGSRADIDAPPDKST